MPCLSNEEADEKEEMDINIDEYFKRIKADPVARAVKIADLTHNMDESRWDEPGAGWADLDDEERKTP